MIDPEGNATWSGNGPGSDNVAAERFDESLPERVRELVDPGRVRELIRSHPLSAAFGALALGYIVARVLRED
jgi:hypothetical protein